MHLDALQQYIRFAISQLSPQNGQAEFEKICLYYGRQRLHGNILPATGPVQAGGDQGRDFETFHTYLSKSDLASCTFLAEFSDKPIVFACSMEKNPTKKNGKIVSDVRTITSGGVPVEKIYFFSGQDIPVAARHKSIDDVKREFQVDLEIIDANALALHLADPDLFWVATQFLKVPAESYPERTAEDWYAKLKREYGERRQPISTYEEFEDVKSAIRAIYKDKALKSDLTFWFPKFDQLIADGAIEALVRKAIYERFVTAFVGLDYVEGQEGNIERYFKNFERYLSNSELEDANHLLSFCQTAAARGRLKLNKDYLEDVSNRMDKLIKNMTENAVTPDNKCAILEIRASFNLNDRRGDRDFDRNFGRYISGLEALVANLGDAHFFPIERLADRLNKNLTILLKITDDVSPLEKIAEKVDDILSKKGSAAIVGGKLRDRAVAFLDAGENGKALRMLHDLKIKWFNQETMEGVIMTCLLIGKTYKKQGLFFASKYFHLVGAFLAHKSKDNAFSDKIIQGLADAGECDYATGAWVSYLGLTETLLHTHVLVTKDFDIYDNDETMQILYYPAIIFKTVKAFLPDAENILKAAVPLYKDLNDDLTEIEEKFLKDLDATKLRESAEREILGIPFNDIAETRLIVFNACGCDWRFSFKNSYRNGILAEEFITIFQIALQELADEDLHLRPGAVSVNIVFLQNGKPTVEEKYVNGKPVMEVRLAFFTGAGYEPRQKYTFDLLVYAQMLLYLQSALTHQAYQKILDPKLKKPDLLEKISFGQAYDVVYREFYRPKIVENIIAGAFNNPFALNDRASVPNEALPWKTNISPLYNAQTATEAIRHRVDNFHKTLSITLPILKKSPWFLDLIADFRSRGWLDWHLLFVVAHIIINKKVNLLGKAKTLEEFERLFRESILKDEREWYSVIAESDLTREQLQQELETLLPISLLDKFGLENKSQQPDFPGFLALLDHRFRFREDGKDILLFDII